MYIFSMRVSGVLGVNIFHCQARKNCRTVFYSEKWPAGMEGGFNLILLSRGAALFRIRDSSFTARKDDFVLWAQGDLREFRAAPHSPVSYDVITFGVMTGQAPSGNGIALDFPPHFRIARPGKARALFRDIIRTHCGKSVFRFQECSVLGIRLLRLLWETLLRPGRLLSEPDALVDGRIQDALNFITGNYKARLDVAGLARRVNMHPVHFNRLFKRATGVAPCRYVLEKKIEKAKDFLGLYGEDPTYTSIELGFHDYSHFYRTFKRLSGMTPSQYRAGLSSRTKEED